MRDIINHIIIEHYLNMGSDCRYTVLHCYPCKRSRLESKHYWQDTHTFRLYPNLVQWGILSEKKHFIYYCQIFVNIDNV
jgi:hypothetical protein